MLIQAGERVSTKQDPPSSPPFTPAFVTGIEKQDVQLLGSPPSPAVVVRHSFAGSNATNLGRSNEHVIQRARAGISSPA